MEWRRQVGIVNDATPGGSAFDDLAAGVIPAADKFIAVENANVAGGDQNLDRNAEIRGVRGMPAPIEFRANPVVTLESIAYPHLVKKFVRMWTGGTDQLTGAPPAAITHELKAIQSGELPAVHVGVVRDEQYDQVAGCTCNTLALNFPYLELAKLNAELRGKYRKRNSAAPPAASYSDHPRRGLLLRDAKVFIDGSPTPLAGLRGFTLNLDNQMVDPPDYHAGANVVVTPLGGIKRRIWWPARHKFMGHAITGSIQFSAPDMDQDLRRELAHQEQLVFECEFEDLGTTPAAVEVMRITGEQMVRTDGGPEQLTKQDEITASYNFGLFVDDGTGEDAVFEFVDASNTPIT